MDGYFDEVTNDDDDFDNPARETKIVGRNRGDKNIIDTTNHILTDRVCLVCSAVE